MKELYEKLSLGHITQEEYEQKKKELLKKMNDACTEGKVHASSISVMGYASPQEEGR